MSIYQDLITKATGVSAKDAGYVEDIMRQDIFHSTLDWQPKGQLVRAARDAVGLLAAYRADPELARHFPA